MSNVESLARAQRIAAPGMRHGPEWAVREGILEIPGTIALTHGGALPGARIAWRIAGPPAAPVVCALGGISADRRVCGTDDPRESWWSEIAGPGRPLDIERFRILSFDFIGGSGESSAPFAGQAFPSISTYDQAELLARLLDHLGIKSSS
jgi:homoserine O-acetyltransferase/O-succinyltransferase